MKKDSVLVKVIAVAATIAVDVAVLFFGSAAVFTKKSSESLSILSEMQVLRFESQIKSEIKLVLQMASSPESTYSIHTIQMHQIVVPLDLSLFLLHLPG